MLSDGPQLFGLTLSHESRAPGERNRASWGNSSCPAPQGQAWKAIA